MIIPSTQSIKYAGSKLKLLSHIISLINPEKTRSILDGFSGSTRVSQAFAQLGYQVTCNDLSEWSHTLGQCYLKNYHDSVYYQEIINHLNSLKSYSGWFTEHYGGIDSDGSAIQKDGTKKPWQIHNTRKLDAIREEIARLQLSDIERSVLLTSLLLALEEADNTLGHQAAYLKNWSSRSYKNLYLQVPKLFPIEQNHRVLKQDIFTTLENVCADLAYFDPPYGSNNKLIPSSRVRYSAYYHIYTTIILNDNPMVFGKANRRIDSKDENCSIFESYKKDDNGIYQKYNAIDKLIKMANVDEILFSYSTEGFLSVENLLDIFNSHCKNVIVHEIDHKRNVMSSMTWNAGYQKDITQGHKELLFHMKKK